MRLDPLVSYWYKWNLLLSWWKSYFLKLVYSNRQRRNLVWKCHWLGCRFRYDDIRCYFLATYLDLFKFHCKIRQISKTFRLVSNLIARRKTWDLLKILSLGVQFVGVIYKVLFLWSIEQEILPSPCMNCWYSHWYQMHVKPLNHICHRSFL